MEPQGALEDVVQQAATEDVEAEPHEEMGMKARTIIASLPELVSLRTGPFRFCWTGCKPEKMILAAKMTSST